LALRVHQERKRDAGVLAKEAGVVPVAKSDGGEPRPFFLEGLLMFAQLRDVLTAEHSTIVPQKHKHRRAVGPQRAELNRTVVRVGQDDACKLCAERLDHSCPFSTARAWASSWLLEVEIQNG